MLPRWCEESLSDLEPLAPVGHVPGATLELSTAISTDTSSSRFALPTLTEAYTVLMSPIFPQMTCPCREDGTGHVAAKDQDSGAPKTTFSRLTATPGERRGWPRVGGTSGEGVNSKNKLHVRVVERMTKT
ncbi:uncharacterized protein PV07_12702 [Cladophialophora immunda]|uniref:Uncharacterized protein n=1 Tax=Cladophialophora immunda TaxID=569365 RepID=A0A0D2BTY4_9EURO|nr:uncharacterized protein PV07_12702 [Cladophialophora immunda]KIW21885.1 hypothetical protein PV07_12702 [Cladophialophora immunda]